MSILHIDTARYAHEERTHHVDSIGGQETRWLRRQVPRYVRRPGPPPSNP
jgi:hypothetical protein